MAKLVYFQRTAVRTKTTVLHLMGNNSRPLCGAKSWHRRRYMDGEPTCKLCIKKSTALDAAPPADAGASGEVER